MTKNASYLIGGFDVEINLHNHTKKKTTRKFFRLCAKSFGNQELLISDLFVTWFLTSHSIILVYLLFLRFFLFSHILHKWWLIL